MKPGALTALLQEIASGPEVLEPGAWEAVLRIGARVGRFELVRELGRGGFGVVWEARDLGLGRRVAFKAVSAGRALALREERLLQEAEAAGRLSHPNIVTLYDVGRSEQGPYLVLELLCGRTLAERLGQGTTPVREALRIAVAMAAGVAHAHAHGVVHRDLKPENVFLCDDGQVKVLDFGLAHAFGLRKAAGGTSGYMAPEQRRGAPEDERTDVYSLGVVLHRMLAGKLPFPDEAHRDQPPGEPPRLEVGTAPALGPLIARMLAQDPVDRPRDGAEVLAALETIERGLPPTGEQAVRLEGPEELRARTPDPERGGGERAARRVGGFASGRRSAWPLVGLASAGALLGLAAAWLALRQPAAPVAARDGRVSVAVADFANETRDPDLDGLSGLLITSLEQSRALRVLTRSRMFDLLRQVGKEQAQRIDEVLAREVGKRAGVRALLLASVRRLEDVYAVELRALDPERDEYLFTLREQASGKKELLGLIDRLGEQIRRNLQESDAGMRAARRGVAEVTTADLTAYEHFFRGRQALDLRHFDRAAEELRAAVAADPEFALAHYQIAVLDAWTVKRGSTKEAAVRHATEHLETALRLADRLPEKERLALLAWKATWEDRLDEARRLRDQAEQAYPQDKEAVFWAGDIRFHTGDLTGAIPFFERALALDPDYLLVQEHIVQALSALDRRDENARWARRWAESAQDGESWRASGRALLDLGQRAEAERAFARATTIDGRYLASAPALLYLDIHEGRATAAEARARQGLEAARLRVKPDEPAQQELASYARVLVAALVDQGRRREAATVIDQLETAGLPAGQVAGLRLGHGVGIRSLTLIRQASAELDALHGEQESGIAVEAATGFAFAGDAQEASARLARARALPGFGAVRPESLAVLEALISWRLGQLEEAESRMRALSESPLVDTRYNMLQVLGLLELERGRPAAALQALEQARAIPWTAATSWRAYLEVPGLAALALSYDRTGDPRRAGALSAEVLRRWRRADPGVPLLADVKALGARLAAGAR